MTCGRATCARRVTAPVAVTVAAVASVLAAAGARANFAPLARATASPAEVFVGAPVSFSSAESIDPDDGPSALSFSWTFGDGSSSEEAAPSHSYGAPGLYTASLEVTDGDRSALAFLDVVVLAPVLPSPSAASAPIALDPLTGRVFIVNGDSGTISVVDAETYAVVAEIAIGRDPRSVALSQDGSRVFVSAGGDGALIVLDAATLLLATTTRVGHMPRGLVVSPPDGRVLVVNEGSGTLTILSQDGASVLQTLDVGPDPRAVAVSADGERAFVPSFLSRGEAGRVLVVDLATDEVAPISSLIALAYDEGPDTPSSGRGMPNLLGAAALSPSGALFVGGLKSNTARGLYVSGEELSQRNRVRGVLARIDVGTLADDPAARIDTNDADSVSAIAFSPSGRYAYLAHRGLGALSVYDLAQASAQTPSDGAALQAVARIDVGDTPDGIVASPDGARLFVACTLARELVVVDVADPAAPSVVARVAVTEEPLPAAIANGKRLFSRSAGPRHSLDGYIACASCHPDGGHDGRTWDFTHAGEGLRNTIDLRGRGGTAHGPVHWSANFDEIQDFENDVVYGFGGTGLAGDGLPPHPPLGDLGNASRSEDLDDLAAYVSSLVDGVASPFRADDGSLSESAARGRAIFLRDDVGCTDCHALPRFTDSVLTGDSATFVLRDVGTLTAASGGRLGGSLTGLDTPSLIGAWASAPYLHDGSAATVRDVLTTRNADDRHGTTSTLTAAEVDDLVAYVLSIDREEGAALVDGGTLDGGGDVDGPDAGESAEPPDGGRRAGEARPVCACGALSSTGVPDPFAVSFIAWAAWGRRRCARARGPTP